MLAAVVRAIHSALLRFDQGIDAIRIAARNADANAPHNPIGKAVALQSLPCSAAVDGFIQSAARAAAIQAVRRAHDLPQAGEENARIVGIENYIDAAGVIVFVQNLVPGLAAVASAKMPRSELGP